MSHHCHAALCTVQVAPKLFMCPRHWSLVPAHLKRAIWSTYRPGQEIDKRPSADYLEVTHRVIRTVALREGIRWELRVQHPPGRWWSAQFFRERPERALPADGSMRLIDLGAEELFAPELLDV